MQYGREICVRTSTCRSRSAYGSSRCSRRREQEYCGGRRLRQPAAGASKVHHQGSPCIRPCTMSWTTSRPCSTGSTSCGSRTPPSGRSWHSSLGARSASTLWRPRSRPCASGLPRKKCGARKPRRLPERRKRRRRLQGRRSQSSPSLGQPWAGALARGLGQAPRRLLPRRRRRLPRRRHWWSRAQM